MAFGIGEVVLGRCQQVYPIPMEYEKTARSTISTCQEVGQIFIHMLIICLNLGCQKGVDCRLCAGANNRSAEKLYALEQVIANRWQNSIPPTDADLKSRGVLRVDIASAG